MTWTDWHLDELHRPYLPMVPSAFQFPVRQPGNAPIERGDIIATARGLEIDVMFGPCALGPKESQLFMAILSCAVAEDPLSRVAIIVEPLTPEAPDTAYTRVMDYLLIQLHPEAGPSILKFDRDSGSFEIDFMRCMCHFTQLWPRQRILIYKFQFTTIVRSYRHAVFSLLPSDPAVVVANQRSGVYVIVPGIEKVKRDARQSKMVDDTVMRPLRYTQPSSGSRGEDFGDLRIHEVWYLGNGTSAFLVLWGISVPELGISVPHGNLIAWVET